MTRAGPHPAEALVGWSERADAAGWTRARFAAAAREVESWLDEATVEGLRIDSWSLAWACLRA